MSRAPDIGPDRADEFAEDWTRDLSLTELAEKYGSTVSTVSYTARRLGLSKRHPGRRSSTALVGGEWVRDPARGVMVWRKGAA